MAGEDYFVLQDGSGLIQLQSGSGFLILQSSPTAGTGEMPNLVGLILQEALQDLQDAGILVPALLGYFGTYPITVDWIESTDNHGVVQAQSIAPYTTDVAPNTPITLTVNDYVVAVAFP
jgi:hypothetical protein